MTGSPLPLLNRRTHPKWCLWLLPLGIIIILGCIPLDRKGANIAEAAMAIITALACFAVVPLFHRAHVRAFALLATLTLAVLFLPILFASQPANVLHHLVRSRVPLLALAMIWLATPCLFQFAIALKRWPHHRRSSLFWGNFIITLSILYAFLVAATNSAALFPRIAWTHMREDLFPAIILLIIVIRSARMIRITPGPKELIQKVLPHALLWPPAITVLSMAIVLSLYHAGIGREIFIERAMILVEQRPDQREIERILFPLSHHNRAAYYLLVSGITAAAAGLLAIPRRTMGMWGLVVLLACFIMTGFTLTRGAILAWAMATLVGVILALPGYRRVVLGILFALGLTSLMTLPPETRQHLSQTLQILQAKPGPENTINSRLALWQMALDSIERRPWTGFGFGTGSFVETMRDEFPQQMAVLGGSSHAHNVILEVAAQSGIPAALLLMGISFVVALGIFGAWYNLPPNHPLRRPLALAIVLGTAIFVYGLSNYPLRRSLGLYTVFLLALAIALAETAYAWMRRHPRITP